MYSFKASWWFLNYSVGLQTQTLPSVSRDCAGPPCIARFPTAFVLFTGSHIVAYSSKFIYSLFCYSNSFNSTGSVNSNSFNNTGSETGSPVSFNIWKCTNVPHSPWTRTCLHVHTWTDRHTYTHLLKFHSAHKILSDEWNHTFPMCFFLSKTAAAVNLTLQHSFDRYFHYLFNSYIHVVLLTLSPQDCLS